MLHQSQDSSRLALGFLPNLGAWGARMIAFERGKLPAEVDQLPELIRGQEKLAATGVQFTPGGEVCQQDRTRVLHSHRYLYASE